MAKKKATKKRATKKSVNKAQAIRDYAKSKPGAGPTEISKALAAKGVKVTPGQVSTTLSNAKRNGKKKPAKTTARKPKLQRTKTQSDSVNVADLLTAQKFVNEIGGVSAARHLISVVDKLHDS